MPTDYSRSQEAGADSPYRNHSVQQQQQQSGGLAGVIELRIGKYLSIYADTEPLKGWVFGADTDFDLPNVEKTMQPDVAFVSIERLPFPDRHTVKVAPDLAVEVYSKSDSNYSTEDKVKDYLAAGVKLVWVVRPINQLIEVYRPNEDEPIVYGVRKELDGGEVLPGFKLRVADIFRNLPPEALAPEPTKRKPKRKDLDLIDE